MQTEGVTYSMKDFMRLLEANESKPKIDPKIIRDDAKNNTEATAEILKQTAEYNNVGDIKRDTPPENPTDYNRTPLDVNFTVDPDKAYKERIQAQVEGYPSVANKKSSDVKENDSLDYEGNKKFYDNREKVAAEREEALVQLRRSGLTAQHLDPEKFERNTAYTKKNEEKMKRLTFKTTFLNESEVIKKIPADYCFNGSRFIMEDREGTQYVIECKADSVVERLIHPNIVGVYNERKLQEEKNRWQELLDYKHTDSKAVVGKKCRLSEDKQFGDIMNDWRKLLADKNDD